MFQVMPSEIDYLQSNQEETDPRIMIYIKYAENQGVKSVGIHTPDTEICGYWNRKKAETS